MSEQAQQRSIYPFAPITREHIDGIVAEAFDELDNAAFMYGVTRGVYHNDKANPIIAKEQGRYDAARHFMHETRARLAADCLQITFEKKGLR